MIAKVALLLTFFAVAHATLVAPGVVAPGLWNAGIIAPGLGLRAAPVWGAPIAAGPVAWGNGLVSPLGLKGAGILTAPGVVKTIL